MGENTLETLKRCNRVIFDKTGTLTAGQLTLREIVACDGVEEAEAAAIAAALEQQVRHPFAQAFADVEPAPGDH